MEGVKYQWEEKSFFLFRKGLAKSSLEEVIQDIKLKVRPQIKDTYVSSSP